MLSPIRVDVSLAIVMESIPNVPEHLATGEILLLYHDIKATLQVPSVNLVWRHLATIDGALGQVWNCVKPLYGDPNLAAGADALRNVSRPPKLDRWSRADLLTLGVTSSDLNTLRAIFANYDQSNPRNLLALMALRAKLNGEPALPSATIAGRDNTQEVIDGTLPRLVPVNEMSPDTQRAAQVLHRIGIRETYSEVVAGVPRHLANWPSFLRLCAQTLLPLDAEIDRGISIVQQLAHRTGRTLISALGEVDLPREPQEVLSALDKFTSRELIANYIVKVQVLLTALPR